LIKSHHIASGWFHSPCLLKSLDTFLPRGPRGNDLAKPGSSLTQLRNAAMQLRNLLSVVYSPPMALRVGKMIHGVTLLLGVTLFSDNPTWSRRCFWLRWSCLLFFSQTLVYKCTNVNCQATSTSGRSELSPGGLFGHIQFEFRTNFCTYICCNSLAGKSCNPSWVLFKNKQIP
jgi:hypothetical protein